MRVAARMRARRNAGVTAILSPSGLHLGLEDWMAGKPLVDPPGEDTDESPGEDGAPTATADAAPADADAAAPTSDAPPVEADAAARALFESYKKLMMSSDPKERAKVPGVIQELLDKYPHTDLVKEKKRFLEIILRSLSDGDDKKPDDK